MNPFNHPIFEILRQLATPVIVLFEAIEGTTAAKMYQTQEGSKAKLYAAGKEITGLHYGGREIEP